MAHRKKYSAYGSCQALALAKMLNSCPAFARDWELLEMEECFAASEEQMDRHLVETIPKLDLFLYQPVSKGYRGEKFSSEFLRNSLSPSGVALSVQYMHWEGYHPTVNMPYGLPPHPESYVDVLIAGAVVMGVDKGTYVRRLEEIGASLHIDIDKIEDWCADELRSREAGENDGGRQIDVLVTDFILANYRQKRLFYTMNHPTAVLMREIAARCMLALGYTYSDISFDQNLDPLDVTQISLYPIYRDCFDFYELDRMNEFQVLYKKKAYEPYLLEQFEWFGRSSKDEVSAFFERVAANRGWVRTALRRAFES
ncbi:WcbI family polysaccharide biosynthesis putative acetyltransferase [Burkholderia sp. BCC0322]|uniref:WcbI family polysaccharide biosynthesis putative acetyltransferase n=1 Tax=unclassified Burkholderia TaxID=2613784 RepID=UPI00158A2038|nr:WcbI family polysaccharide biosynthesis putative acetyltransferase [Burkholderia sp. BCC0322]